MPIQVSEHKFVEYRYDPDYLQSRNDRRLKTYPDVVCDKIGLKTIKTEIILDGGNVIKGKDKVILTDKIIPENSPKYLKHQLIDALKGLFEVDKVILIPWYIKEPFSHADGMIRFIDNDNVLVDGYYKKKKPEFATKFYQVLKQFHLNPVELELKVPNARSKNWGYINFLQLRDLILIPRFGIDEDDQAFNQFLKLFPSYGAQNRILQIESNAIIRHGGVLNCASWNIMS